jgi:hypothetical protein
MASLRASASLFPLMVEPHWQNLEKSDIERRAVHAVVPDIFTSAHGVRRWPCIERATVRHDDDE